MVANLTLVIGNKNHSSWSLRAWLALEHTGQPYGEIVIALDPPGMRQAIAQHSPSGRVPALRHGGLVVWDSLAIAEYLAEAFPGAGLLPDDVAARAVARAVSAEMHSGFADLRASMPMDVEARLPGYGRTMGALRDIERVRTLWADCRARFGAGGPYLFGRFSIADAMFGPVVFRFRTYDVALDGAARAYADAMLADPAMQKWSDASAVEELPYGDPWPEVRA
jgi:glutathione S-transferase